MDEHTLFKKIVSSTAANRADIVSYLRLVSRRAQSLPLDRLTERSGDSPFRESQTPGELIAANIFHALLIQDNVDSNIDPYLEHVKDIANDLVEAPDGNSQWQALFVAIDQLRS